MVKFKAFVEMGRKWAVASKQNSFRKYALKLSQSIKNNSIIALGEANFIHFADLSWFEKGRECLEIS